MRHVYINSELERHAFAKKAALAFEGDSRMSSYGEVTLGGYLALRWGLGNDCVLVLKLDDYFEPELYTHLIKTVERAR